MKIKLLVLLLFLSVQSFSQKGKISGYVTHSNNDPLAFTTVYIEKINKVFYTNNLGFFTIPKLNYGKYVISYYLTGFTKKSDTIILDQPYLNLSKVTLEELSYDLEEYEIKQEEEFNIRKLRAIEGVMITQGKKTEAISVESLDANKATNQSRQIYSKIPGINIWESDGAGIQLGLGGRGLNPSRNSNYNTRQNGYDISADALGYPESYYSPPSEAIQEIQLIRGAASLQFGPQFGGLINFKLKEGNPDKKIESIIRHTVGSYKLNNSFVSLGGTNKKFKYYGFINLKSGDDWRANSNFDLKNGYLHFTYSPNEKTNLNFDFTKMDYLAQQPGGLTDQQFDNNPDTSFRERNWFKVDWNLAAFQLDYEFNSRTRLNSRTFGLIASRESLGYLDQINRIDPLLDRNLISGNFKNIGNETRLIHLYDVNNLPWAFLIGARLYRGFSQGIQGKANNGYGPDFYFVNDLNNISSDFIESNYNFPSFNFSLFAEHIFNISNRLSITPGIRYENINTSANGAYRINYPDLAGNIVFDTVINVDDQNNRDLLLTGIGLNFKLNEEIEVYSNISQNYRSVNFTDMQIRNPNFRIDPVLKDEVGYNSDLGIRGKIKDILYFDASLFYLFYNNRIGNTIQIDSNLFNTYQYRTNISESRTYGFESVLECDWWKIFSKKKNYKWTTFLNIAYNDAEYISSDISAFFGKKVEMVPPLIFRTGMTIGGDNLSVSYQYSYTKEHFSDATNSDYQINAVVGLISSYSVMDVSLKYSFKKFQLETGINNLTNQSYFTRRAVAYPGPGIIPSMPRNFYICLQIKL